ncbi:scavenger receptor cysteine-rich domain superfamily protein-like isoform X3 [Oscarella lobularis]|uniref:scavenger receptor cysteine-rich domain superfamily protein-like isoform X3 n=1 Tax=Oscarella lobularis TaxID=121494 RepID=UPI0033142709
MKSLCTFFCHFSLALVLVPTKSARIYSFRVGLIFSFIYMHSAVMVFLLCAMSTSTSRSATAPPLDFDVHLSGSSYGGSLEIFDYSDFRYKSVVICDNSWDETDAAVICTELFDNPLKGTERKWLYSTVSPNSVAVKDIDCPKAAKSLSECQFTLVGAQCDSSLYAYEVNVECDPLIMRLSGGNSIYEGTVEVFNAGQWNLLTICDNTWNKNDGTVVCENIFGFPLKNTATKAYSSSSNRHTLSIANVRCSGAEKSVLNCTYDDDACSSSWNLLEARVECYGSTLRLTDGPSPNEGRVEIYHDGEWGTICNDQWESDDAVVVCDVLFSTAVKATSIFDQGAVKRIWLDEVKCKGNEKILENCVQHNDWNKVHCNPIKLAGVSCEDTNVRLRDGTSPTNGRVEIYHKRQWGAVCSHNWNLISATILCDQLFYTDAVSADVQAFGLASGKTWLDDVGCNGRENSLDDCVTHYDWSSPCYSAGAVCSDKYVRLVGGSKSTEGRVEVYLNRQWNSVCEDTWSLDDANGVCDYLFSTGAISATGPGSFGVFSGKSGNNSGIASVACLIKNGNSPRVCQEKVKDSSQACQGQQNVGVRCYDADVRLLDGPSPREGRVEIFHNKTWGTICDSGWDIEDANVVCNQLFSVPAVEFKSGAYYGSGTGKVWLENVGCKSSDTKLSKCSNSGWGTSSCSHGRDVGVACYGTNIRLQGGSSPREGRVEVYRNNAWSSVCGDASFSGWNKLVGNVICQQLFSTEALSVDKSFGSGSGDILYQSERVPCTGAESNLADCPVEFHGLDGSACDHSKDAGLVCLHSGNSIRLVNGVTPKEGRVEIYHNLEWGTISKKGWDVQDANVVCRQLGYGDAVNCCSSKYGQGSGKVWLEQVDCTGFEDDLVECSSRGWGTHSSSHADDVGIICTGAIPPCGDLLAPENGALSGFSNLTGETAFFSCNQGYSIVGSASRTCQRDGKWSGIQPLCHAQCQSLSAPLFGAVAMDNTTIGGTATFTCLKGYNLHGSSNRVCQNDGTWSGTEASCQIVDCGSPGDLANGVVYAGNTTYNSAAFFVCNHGYSIKGLSTRVCLSSDKWSGTPANCLRAQCQSLSAPLFGAVAMDNTTIGGTATFTCLKGYNLHGSSNRVCQNDGTWNGTEASCQIVDCGSPGDLANGVVYAGNTTYNSAAFFVCNHGYSIEGLSTRVCLSSGKWSGKPANCLRETAQTEQPGQPEAASDCEETTMIPYFAVIAVLAVAVLVLSVLLIVYCRKYKSKQSFQPAKAAHEVTVKSVTKEQTEEFKNPLYESLPEVPERYVTPNSTIKPGTSHLV